MDDTPCETIADGTASSWSVAELLTLRRRAKLWLVPVLVALTAVVGSWVVVGTIEGTFQRTLEKKLRTIVSATSSSVALWSEQQTLHARILAGDDRIERLLTRVILNDDEKVQAIAKKELTDRLEIASRQFGFRSFMVIDSTGETIASNSTTMCFDDPLLSEISQVFCGDAVFAKPSAPEPNGISGRVASLHVAAPIQRRRSEEILATLVCEIPSDGPFQRTLALSTFGETGENLAVDRSGNLVGRGSPTGIKEQSEMSSGKVPIESPKSSPVVQAMFADETGEAIIVDPKGYVTAAGDRVVGGAQWLPEFGLGVVSTIEYDEAYASHNLFKRINSIVTSFALICSLVGLIYTWYLSRAQLRAMKAERRLKKLGQYSLEEKIGEGAMGEVHRATHRMLRRPTAVKLLPAEKSSPQTIERFEREVQLSSQLTHPNTISIYDYGRTPEGVFYYAMEYLDGVDLKKLVEREGAQPEARVVHILRQVCGSLSEAHDRGLVHRDIKPANVILCQRGGRYDVAKLLDFGLVYDAKSLHASMESSGINGTPAFMSPESINSPGEVDHRSDIYSIGAVAYFLLTGQYTFTGSKVTEIWDQQLNAQPLAPSVRTSNPVSRMLEELTMRCLSIDPKQRPQSVVEVEETLAGLHFSWTQEEAAETWFKPVADAERIIESEDDSKPAETLVYAM